MELLIFIGVMAYVWFKIGVLRRLILTIYTSVNSETATSGNLLPNAGVVNHHIKTQQTHTH